VLRLLIIAIALVLAGVWYVGGSPAVPRDTDQFAPPPTPRTGELSFELTEATLAERLNQRLAGQPLGETPLGPATLTRLTTKLKPGQILATGDAQVAGTSVPVAVTGHLDIQDGRPLVSISDARAAGVPLPSVARESLRSAIQEQVDQEIARLPMRVKSVTILDGKLLVIGTRLSS
jgi:hypothetical protein